MTMEIDIIDPKAENLLKDLADMNLISIRRSTENTFTEILEKIRKKAAINTPLSIEEITQEVEQVRAERYAGSKE